MYAVHTADKIAVYTPIRTFVIFAGFAGLVAADSRAVIENTSLPPIAPPAAALFVRNAF